MSVRIASKWSWLAVAIAAVSLTGTIAKGASASAIPFSFEQNRGQVHNSGVQFLARSRDGVLLLYRDRLTLRNGHAAATDLVFKNSSATTTLIGDGEATGRVNYLRGSTSSDWVTDIPSYEKVRYQNLYRGIDLLFYGSKGHFESDFIIAPHASPSQIKFQMNGLPSLNANGDVLSGSFQMHRPVIYQVNAAGARTIVEGRYELHRNHELSFSVGRYDHSRPLVIDPVLSYSSYLGGSDDEGVFGIKQDAEGNFYLAGETSSLNFPVSHALQSKVAGDYDCFVTKFDREMKHLRYSTYLGGTSYDHCIGLGVSADGDAFVAGFTFSTDFPVSNALQKSLKGNADGFVARLDRSGSKLIFSTYLGGTGSDYLVDMVIDRRLNVYVTGATSSADFPVTKGSFQTVCDRGVFPGVCSGDAFVTKLSPRGTQMIYSTYLGGSSYEYGNGIAIDFEGAAYITGQTSSSDFPTQSAYQSKLAGFGNAFVTKLSPDGAKSKYSTYLGGSNFDSGSSIGVDWRGNIYVTGSTTSLDFPLVRPFQNQLMGSGDAFMLRLDRTGSKLEYSTYLGGSSDDFPFRMVVDPFGNASVTGLSASPDFPLKDPVQAEYGGGDDDAFVFRFSPGGELLYSTYLGGTGADYGYAIYAGWRGDVWFGGSTASTDFPVKDAWQSTYAGGPYDAFLSHISNSGCSANVAEAAKAEENELPLLQADDLAATEEGAAFPGAFHFRHCY